MITVRPAEPSDLNDIIRFIRLLAEFDSTFSKIDIDRGRMEKAYFGEVPKIFALLAIENGKVLGLANYFFTFSSFQAKTCIWLEDLYVLKDHRKEGVGKVLLKELNLIAKEHDCKHIEWLVAAENENGIAFYKHLGADIKESLRYVQWPIQHP